MQLNVLLSVSNFQDRITIAANVPSLVLQKKDVQMMINNVEKERAN